MRRTAVLALLLLTAPAAAWADVPPPPATEIAQQVTLSQAAAAGIVGLKAKGGFGGDDVAVDLEGARVPGAPVTATVRIEFLGAQKDGSPWPQSKADEIAAAIEQRLAGTTASDGTPFTIDVIAAARSGSDPAIGATPGYHQIVLEDRPRASDASMVGGAAGPNGEKTGNWGVNETATTWAHETGHLLGLHDRYSLRRPEYQTPDGKAYKLPQYTGKATDTKASDAWWQSVLKRAEELKKLHGPGDIQPSILKGHEDDIMGDPTGRDSGKRFLPVDVDAWIANAGVHLHASPGDVLLAKNKDEQNLVVGNPLDLYAPKGRTAHRDGLYAYCADAHRQTPTPGNAYDVLGPAGAQGGEYLKLQRVTEEIARRQIPGRLDGPSGAIFAVWAVTDGEDPDADAQSILNAAGVVYDKNAAANSPHFDDPNASSPTTAAVTPTGVVPPVAADRSRAPDTTDPLALPAQQVNYLKLNPRSVRAGRRGTLTLLSIADGSATRWSVTVLRGRGKSLKGALAVGGLTIPVGPATTAIKLPKLRRGSYTLLLTGPDGARRLSFRAVAPKRKR